MSLPLRMRVTLLFFCRAWTPSAEIACVLLIWKWSVWGVKHSNCVGKLGGSWTEEMWLLPKMEIPKLPRFVTAINILVIPVLRCSRERGPANAVSDRNRSRFLVRIAVFSCLLLGKAPSYTQLIWHLEKTIENCFNGLSHKLPWWCDCTKLHLVSVKLHYLLPSPGYKCLFHWCLPGTFKFTFNYRVLLRRKTCPEMMGVRRHLWESGDMRYLMSNWTGKSLLL